MSAKPLLWPTVAWVESMPSFVGSGGVASCFRRDETSQARAGADPARLKANLMYGTRQHSRYCSRQSKTFAQGELVERQQPAAADADRRGFREPRRARMSQPSIAGAVGVLLRANRPSCCGRTLLAMKAAAHDEDGRAL